MGKISLYAKLAFGNLRRNRTTYLPYLLACIVSIFTFYTMVAINTNGALDGIRGEGVVKSFTAIGTIILGLFCSILIFYTNSFLIKRRKKELGLYAILGMEKRNIAAVLFFETLFTALIALVLGLTLGMLLSQLLFWLMLRMIHFDVMIAMPISPAAIGITAALFAVVFLLALLRNLLHVRLTNPIELLGGAKEGEREPKASWLLTLIGLLCLGGGYFVAVYFKSPIDAIMMFLLAVLLVIIGTYCLFTSGSIAMLKLLRKNKKFYYQPRHFISVSGMIYRMKQNAAGLSTICILSCMVLVTVSTTVSLNVGVEDSLQAQYPYEYTLRFESDKDAEAFLPRAEALAEESGVTLSALSNYRATFFMAKEKNGVFTAGDDYQTTMSQLNFFSLFTLEEYNRNENTNETLAPDEALLLVTGGHYTKDTLTVNGVTYRVRMLESFGKQTAASRDLGQTFLVVLPDEAQVDTVFGNGGVENERVRTIAFDLEGSDEAQRAFHAGFGSILDTLRDGGSEAGYSYQVRESARESWYASNGGFLFLGVYFGILFMLAAALIIYYKQISEGYDDAERFEILQKVGMSESEVRRTINRQILTVFFLPLLAAVVHVTVAFFPLSRIMILFGILNIPLLMGTLAATILVYAAIYLLVFRQTARSYFAIVRRAAQTA